MCQKRELDQTSFSEKTMKIFYDLSKRGKPRLTADSPARRGGIAVISSTISPAKRLFLQNIG
jgi:hypothetical protein